MKKNLKIKLLASAAVVATVAPIISLASCAKATPIVIDPSEKTKDLPKGDRIVSYNVTLSSPLQEGEKITCEVENTEASQTGYAVKFDKATYYTGDTKATINVAIDTTNKILEDGSTFKFNLIVKRLNAEGTEIASNKFEGFTIKYAAPVVSGLTIDQDAKAAYTNPAEDYHVYEFDVGSSIKEKMPTNCEFECDVVNVQSTKTIAVFDSASYDKSNNKVMMKIRLKNTSGSELEHGDNVSFYFTLSCKNKDNGNEQWRQSFKAEDGFSLTYINHLLWIVDSYQDKMTYAGEKQFHIYILKNPAITLKDFKESVNVAASFIGTAPTGITSLQVDKDNAKEGKYEGKYEYFDVPVNIVTDGSFQEADTKISYKIEISSTLLTSTLSFNLETKYVSPKVITEETKKSQTLINEDSYEYEFTIAAGELDGLSFDIIDLKTSSPNVSVKVASVTQTGGQTKVKTTIVPDGKDSDASFNFLVTRTNSLTGAIVWQQRVIGDATKQFKLEYINLGSIVSKNIETITDLGSGYFDFDFNTDRNAKLTAVAINEIKAKSEDVAGGSVQLVTETIEGKDTQRVYATMTPVSLEEGFDSNSYIRFDLKATYAATIAGSTQSVDIIYKDCKINFNGSIWIDDDRSKITNIGKTIVEYKFKLYTDDETIFRTEIVNQESSTNYYATLAREIEVKGKEVTVAVEIKTKDGTLLPDNALANFRIYFQGSTGKKVWEREFRYCSITYKSSITCDKTTQDTQLGTQTAYFTLNDLGETTTGFTYNITTKQEASADVIATVDGELEIKDKQIKVPVKLSKKSGQLQIDDTALFDLIIEKKDSTGTSVAKEIVKNCKATYVTDYITWISDDSWYVTEENSGKSGTKAIPVSFQLAKALTSSQSLTFDYAMDETAGGHSANVGSLAINGPINVDGTKVTLPYLWMNKTSGYTGMFNAGDYAKYTVTFTCKEGETVKWTRTVNCVLIMLAEFKLRGPTSVNTKSTADYLYDLTANISKDDIEKKNLILEPSVNVTKRMGVPGDVNVDLSGAAVMDYANHTFKQQVKWSKTEGIEADGWIRFDMNLKISIRLGETSEYYSVTVRLSDEDPNWGYRLYFR